MSAPAPTPAKCSYSKCPTSTDRIVVTVSPSEGSTITFAPLSFHSSCYNAWLGDGSTEPSVTG